MIAKELDPRETSDKRQRAGQRAEAQLAFYLKRAFSSRTDLIVLNDLRLTQGDDVAQIDHLVLHPHGMVVIESKSIGSALKVNAQGEWLRLYQNHYQGMPSPKLQAERQVQFLRRFLVTEVDAVLDKGRDILEALPIDTLVAISDKAVIRRETPEPLDYLVKAEQVPGRLEVLMQARTPARNWFRLGKPAAGFAESELLALAQFLQGCHTPLDAVPAKEVVEAPEVSPAYRCKHCESDTLEVRWGKHSYYFKCLTCEGNTWIAERCGTCQEKLRLRKDGKQFYAECGVCKTSAAFYRNP